MLEVEDLKVELKIDGQWVPITTDIRFKLNAGDTFGLVGESGCGKSITSKAIMGLLEPRTSRIGAKKLYFENKNLLDLNAEEWRAIRGNQISMIFQNPMTHLNPLMTCGKQIRESILLHQKLNKKSAEQLALEMLKKLEMPNPSKAYNSYPHEMSGGMKQRVMIGMALACKPKLLIADEPTTALDVTIQAQILELIKSLQSEYGMALIMITHDLGVVADLVQQLAVMYAGQIIELGPTEQVLNKPKHPYTKGLIQSIPKLNTNTDRLSTIEGRVPSPQEFPNGCRFYQRCPYKENNCKSIPYNLQGQEGHLTACQRVINSEISF